MENLYITLAVAVVLISGFGVVSFLLVRFIKKQDERLKLIMKTLYLNTKGIKSVGEKTDVIIQEQQTGFDFQRKSFDHQRVLVSSLARQLKHIEAALYSGGNLDPTGGEQPHNDKVIPLETVHQPQMAEQQPLRNSTVTSFVREQRSEVARQQGVTLLKSLFDKKQARNMDTDGNQQKVARLSALFSNQNAARSQGLGEQQRRVSNG